MGVKGGMAWVKVPGSPRVRRLTYISQYSGSLIIGMFLRNRLNMNKVSELHYFKRSQALIMKSRVQLKDSPTYFSSE